MSPLLFENKLFLIKIPKGENQKPTPKFVFKVQSLFYFSSCNYALGKGFHLNHQSEI